MKRFLFLAVALVLCGIVNVQAAGDEKNGHAYFTKAQLPNMANILPAVQHGGPAKVYRIDGTPATNDSKGIVITNGQKVVVQ